MSTIRTELQRIAAKVESTEGTAESLSASDGDILATNIKWQHGIPMYGRASRSATFSKFPRVAGAQMATLTFDVELYGNGGTAPGYGALLSACSIVGATVSTTYTLTPTSTAASIPSLTIGSYVDGRLRKMVGARGMVKLSAKTGEPMIASFTFQGVDVAPTDTTILADATFTTTSKNPPAFMGANFSLGGLSSSEALLKSIEIDYGVGLTMRSDANASTGYRSCALVGRDVTGTVVIEMPLVSEHAPVSIQIANTTGALAFAFGNSSDKISGAAPVVQYLDVQEDDDGELLTATIKFACCRSSGNDELVLTLGS